MRKYIAAISIFVAILCWHAEVEASCISQTIWGPEGKVTICTTCCLNNYCTTSCL